MVLHLLNKKNLSLKKPFIGSSYEKKIFTLFGLTLFKYYQKGKTSLNILAPLANPHIFEILNNYQSETEILGGISTLESICDTWAAK